MKRWYFILVLLAGACKCDDVVPDDCIDESKISSGPCTMEYMPVCGCNNVTYGNGCSASRAGVTSWTAGACRD